MPEISFVNAGVVSTCLVSKVLYLDCKFLSSFRSISLVLPEFLIHFYLPVISLPVKWVSSQIVPLFNVIYSSYSLREREAFGGLVWVETGSVAPIWYLESE